MTPGARSLLLALTIAAALVGAKVWQDRLIAKGDAQGAARVQAAWDAQELLRSQVTAGTNTLRQRNAEKVANEQAQKDAQRQAAAAHAADALRSLRAELARFKSRANRYPAGDAGIAACSGEATTARELLGESSGAYQLLAAEADELRDQVAGLQRFARDVCHAGQPAAATAGGAD